MFKHCFLTILIFHLLANFSYAQEIKLFTWEEYFSETLIKEFEQKTGHTVSQVYFDSEMVRDVVVYSGKASLYDLFIIDDQTVKDLKGYGTLIDFTSVLKPENNLFTSKSLENCGDFGVPFAQGTMGVGYRSSVIDKSITSWMDVFDYAFQHPNTVVLPDDDIDTIAIALLALNYHPFTDNVDQLKQAFKLLSDVKPKLLELRNSAGYAMDKRDNSKMELAVFYSGERQQISNATDQNDWVYTVPKEGTLLWHECISSHHDSKLTNATIEFLNFISSPNNAMRNATEHWYATSNLAAIELASPAYKSDQELYPTSLGEENSYLYQMMSAEAVEIRANILSVLRREDI